MTIRACLGVFPDFFLAGFALTFFEVLEDFLGAAFFFAGFLAAFLGADFFLEIFFLAFFEVEERDEPNSDLPSFFKNSMAFFSFDEFLSAEADWDHQSAPFF